MALAETALGHYPEAEELYLDRLALEKELGYYSTDWMVLNLTDGEGFRRNLTGSYVDNSSKF